MDLRGFRVTRGMKSGMNARTHEWTSQKQYAPPTFLKLGGIIRSGSFATIVLPNLMFIFGSPFYLPSHFLPS